MPRDEGGVYEMVWALRESEARARRTYAQVQCLGKQALEALEAQEPERALELLRQAGVIHQMEWRP